MSEPIVKPDPEMVRRSVLGKSELAMTLTADEGEWPFALRTVARTMAALDGLLRAIAKDVSPDVKLVPVLIRVDILEDKLRMTVRIDPARRVTRRRVPR